MKIIKGEHTICEFKDRKTYTKVKEQRYKEFSRQTKKQKLTVNDKEVTSNTVSNQKQEGTSKAALKVKEAMKQSGAAIDNYINQHNSEIEENMNQRNKRHKSWFITALDKLKIYSVVKSNYVYKQISPINAIFKEAL